MKTINTKLFIAFICVSMGFGSPLPSGVSIHQLNNGMNVILIENKSLPMVGANVVVKTGSTS